MRLNVKEASFNGSFEFIKQNMQVRSPVVPTEDGDGNGDKTMPALAQATEKCQRAFLQVP